MTQKIAFLDCSSGISGKKLLGALIDAGLSLADLQHALLALPLQGYQLNCAPCSDKGLHGICCDTLLIDTEQPELALPELLALLDASTLSVHVRTTAQSIFRQVAEAEAVVQGESVGIGRFKVIGAPVGIVEIVAVLLGFELLDVRQCYASALPLTGGHVQTAEGILPVPTPLTIEILRRVNAPWKVCALDGELVTADGAALLATLARFETPILHMERVGYGFGKQHQPWPDCLRLCLGSSSKVTLSDSADTDWVSVIETHIDNMSGELLGDLMQGLLAAGALDVSYTPIQMKKNRPATLVTIICTPEEGEQLALLMLRETSTLGVRIQQLQRLKAQRSQQEIVTPLGPMLVKVKRLSGRIIAATPEYEECRRIAKERGLPLSEVYEVARQAIQTVIIQISEN